MKKSFLVIIACIAAVLMFQAFTTTHQPPFKNLKILPKDISDDDLDTVMHHFTASLGVKCNYCHVRNEAIRKMDFASDAKPEKLIARKMMLMSIDINTKYFKDIEDEMSKEKGPDLMKEGIKIDGDSVKNMLSYVTCYTCHRGDAHPDTKPPHHEEGPRPPASPKPDGK
ncbi:MAG: c-type cytochrome [Bacteroidota bacterium]|nr:c-type cytochrome [Bacteroidota bacterium]